MKHQQVTVDYWNMAQAMFKYGLLTVLGWVLFRLLNTVFTLPGKMKNQRSQINNSIEELKRRFPDLADELDKDEETLKKELDELLKETKKEDKPSTCTTNTQKDKNEEKKVTSAVEENVQEESKKVI